MWGTTWFELRRTKENSRFRNDKKSMLKSLNSRINGLRKISRFANFKTRKMIANGIFQSKLIYLIQLWGGTNNYLLNFLQIVQNRAARLVTKLGWFTPTETLLTQCGWLSVNQLVCYHTLLQIFKTRKDKVPTYFYEKFSNNFPRNTRLGNSNRINLNKTINSQLGERNFTTRGIGLWNNLPVELRQLSTLPGFKSKFKKWIKSNVAIR